MGLGFSKHYAYKTACDHVSFCSSPLLGGTTFQLLLLAISQQLMDPAQNAQKLWFYELAKISK